MKNNGNYTAVDRNELSPSAEFDEEQYLEINPDVADAVRRGEFASGREHWEKHGVFETEFGRFLSRKDYVRSHVRVLIGQSWRQACLDGANMRTSQRFPHLRRINIDLFNHVLNGLAASKKTR